MAEADILKTHASTDDASMIKAAWQRHLASCAGVAKDEYGSIIRSGLFDADFYLETYADIREAGVDALSHYMEHGAREGRSPNRWFDANYYRAQFGAPPPNGNPLLHYIEHGEASGLKPHPKFDPRKYRAFCPAVDVAGVSPLWHFLRMGSAEYDTSISVAKAWQNHLDSFPSSEDESAVVLRTGLFDSAFYLETYADVREGGIDPLGHYVAHGAREKRSPNRWFDANYYRTQFGAFPASINPLLHYVEKGEPLGFKPHPHFDPRKYRDICPGLEAAGVSALWHFLHFGSPEYIALMQPQHYKPATRVEAVKPALRKWLHSADQQVGVNFVSPASRIAGLGVSARGFLDALQHANIPVHAIEWTRGFEHHASREMNFSSAKALQPINLIHMNADIFHLVANGLRQNGVMSPDRYNIGIWYWELASFRPEWMQWIACLDEIWCASEFNVRAISAVSARPVNLMRPALLPIQAEGKYGRSHFGLGDDSTVFFYNCDLSSRIDRKNPEALIAAFQQEFGEDPAYQLVLKIGAPTYSAQSTELVVRAVGGAPNIRLIDRTLTDGELADLLGLSFAYVSPHRSEGLGLTIIEAMLASCPVIATGYGGSADFVFDDVARPLSYDLVELARTDEPYRRGCVWADPHIADLRAAMRELVTAPEAAKAMGLRGKAHVESLFSPETTAKALQARLQEIWMAGSPNQG